MSSAPPLPAVTCGCKRGRCPTCLLCSRCGCEHDGVPIAQKTKRGRGRPKQLQTPKNPLKIKENHNNSALKGGTTDRSDATTRLDGRPRRTVSLGKTYEEEEELEDCKTKTYQDILRYFGEDERTITNLVKHCGSTSARRSLDTWTTTDNSRMKSVVFQMYERVLRAVATAVCGEEAADASVAAFIQKNTPKEESFGSSKRDVPGIFRPLASAMNATKRNSIERRTVRAMMCGLFKHSEMCRMEDEIPGFQIGKNSFSKGRDDFEKLVKDGVLPTEVYTRERFEQNQIVGVVKSILSCDNVTYRLGETKRIVLGGRYYDVPAIMRRTFMKSMWDRYIKEIGNASHVSLGAFYRICRVLTHGDERKPTEECGLLIDDNFLTLKRIISDFAPDKKAELFQCLDALRNWLEYWCFSDINAAADPAVGSCPRHQPGFGLAARNVSILKDGCCGPCEGMNTLFSHITKVTKRKGADTRTLSTLRDCFEKVELYMGHRLRAVNQQRAVSKVLNDMRMRANQGEGLDEAIVTIDFKLNTEPVLFHDNTMEVDGKSGMKWHGAMVHFWTAEPEATDPGQMFSEQKLYYNYISTADSNKAKYVAAGLIEAVLMGIKRDLPQIKRVVIHSENAPTYQNAFVAVMLPIIGYTHGIEVMRFIQTEAEAGTSLLDTHFTLVARKVNAWMRQDHVCTTPNELVAVLVSDGGLPDTTTEIVECNHESLQLLSDQVGGLEISFAKLVGKVNDIVYEFDRSLASIRREENESAFDLMRCPSVWVRAFKYSQVGLGKLLELNTVGKTCALEACDDGSLADTIDPYEEEGEEETCEANWEQRAAAGNDGVGNNEEDSELNLFSEIILPRCAVGLVTGVRVISEAQIRRRTMKLSCSRDAVAVLPSSREPKHNIEKDMVTCTKQHLLAMASAHSRDVVDVSKLYKEMITLKYRFSNDHNSIQSRLQQGWAQSPSKERIYSVKYVPRYLSDVKALLKQGGVDRHDKMGPTRIVEVLRSWNAKRYDIPGENEVRAAISRLRDEQRKRGIPCNESFKPRKKQRMEQKYADYLQELVTTIPNIGRKEAVSLFRKTFPEATELYSDARLKSKVSIIKGVLSKSAPNE